MARKKGDQYKCDECGLVLLVENPCECDESCEILCCEEPMKPVKAAEKTSSSKAPAKTAAKPKK